MRSTHRISSRAIGCSRSPESSRVQMRGIGYACTKSPSSMRRPGTWIDLSGRSCDRCLQFRWLRDHCRRGFHTPFACSSWKRIQRTECPGTTSFNAMAWARHLSRTYGHRGAKRQPIGGLIGDVGSPTSVTRSRISPGTLTSCAEISALVYGLKGAVSTVAVGPSSIMWPRYITAARVAITAINARS